MRRLILFVAVLAGSLALTALVAPGPGQADNDDNDDGGGSQTYAVGLWGDLPYSDVQASEGVPRLVTDMNRSWLAFSVHAGDIKSGSTRCDNPVYAQAEARLNMLRAPAMYTPGDNEWTDCDRVTNGAYSSFERLQYIRTTMFDTPYSFGKDPIRLDVQAAPYVENRRWRVGKVTYATLYVTGSNNNLGDVAPDPAEYAARNAATNAWMRETFDRAVSRNAKGVMLFVQANPGFDRDDPNRAPVRDPRTLLSDAPPPAPNSGTGFDSFLLELRREAIEFGRPVVLVHGDSHYFRVDKPLLDRNGHRIEHFTRVETPGDNAQSANNDVQWVKVNVDSRNPEVFSFEQEIVEANAWSPYTP